jgi:hypothetical protein
LDIGTHHALGHHLLVRLGPSADRHHRHLGGTKVRNHLLKLLLQSGLDGIEFLMSRSSEPKDGTVSASQGEIPSLTTRPPLVQQIERDEDDVQTTTPAQDIPRKGRLPPGFWPQEHTTAVTEEAGRMEPVSTTTDSVSLEASGELPVNSVDASGDASGSGDAGMDETKSSSPQMPHLEELLPVSNSHSTMDTWSRFLTFQDSGRTTRQAPPFVQASDHHDYSDYSEGDSIVESL